jgi:hypothetical protein
MIDAIANACSGLKTAAEIVQGLLTLKVDAAISTKVFELNGVISELYQRLNAIQQEHPLLIAENLSLVRRAHELEAEVSRLKNWEEEKKRYDLQELAIPFQMGSSAVRATTVLRLFAASGPLHSQTRHCEEASVDEWLAMIIYF